MKRMLRRSFKFVSMVHSYTQLAESGNNSESHTKNSLFSMIIKVYVKTHTSTANFQQDTNSFEIICLLV